MSKPEISIGTHRPVYLWAGPGTIRMNRLKFMDAPVDEGVHFEAHTQVGAQRMREAGFDWAYLMYDWGFPPEVEQEDWDDFTRAVRIYQEAGLRTFGYIQTSNCAYSGSYREKDWYARDPRGRLIYYYTGRHMTCWLHPEWIEHLKQMVRGVIEAGAEGVFFDNPWHAGQPLSFAGTWMGGAGCYCPRCRDAYRQAHNTEIPTTLNPSDDEASRTYLRWRTGVVTNTLAELAAYARALKPNVLVSANDFDAVMRPSYVIYGIDLPALAKVQDTLMIEDFALPRWEADQRMLINNALTLRTARALAGDTPVTTIPYDKGIGFDEVYPADRFVQGVVEAAACGAPAVVKGTEFFQDGQFTLLTAEPFSNQRDALGEVHAWLEEHADVFSGGENTAAVGLLFPGEELWFDWHRLSPRFFGAGQALTAAGLPWKVVARPEQLAGVEVLLTFGDIPAGWEMPDNLRTVRVLDLPGWSLDRPSAAARIGRLRAPLAWLTGELFRSYFHSRLARKVLDGVGLSHFFLASPLFLLPEEAQIKALLSVVGHPSGPQAVSAAPVLVELWQRGGNEQIHLVNYARAPQTVTVRLSEHRFGRVISPGRPDQRVEGETISLELDAYAILLLD